MCTDPFTLNVIKFLLTVFDILTLVVPVFLIIMGAIDFFKIVVSGDGNKDSKNVSDFVKRAIFAVLLFFVPLIIKTSLVMIGNSSYETTFADCIKNTENIEYYKELAAANKKKVELNLSIEKDKLVEIENETIKANSGSEDDEDMSIIPNPDLDLVPEEPEPDPDKPEVNPLPDKPVISVSIVETVGGGSYGKYDNLTDEQLYDLTRVCMCEQSGALKIEASFMANLYETRGMLIKDFTTKYGESGDGQGLYKYIFNGGWFYCAKDGVYNRKNKPFKPTDAQINEVKQVLVKGYRPLPLYIDEHDLIDDVVKIKNGNEIVSDNDSINNHSSYKKFKTVIYTRYSAEYTFFGIYPDTKFGDVFGYTDAAKKLYSKVNGK